MTTAPEIKSADDILITKPRLRLLLEQPGQDNLVQLDIQTDNRDQVRFDVMRARQGWPGGDVAPMLWMTVQAWSAIKRAGLEPWSGMAFEKFNELCVDLNPIDRDGNLITDEAAMLPGAGMAADPTRPAAAPD